MAVQDSVSSPRGFYETYWSPEGFNPVVRLRPTFRRILEDHLPGAGSLLDFGCGDGRTYGQWLQSRVKTYVGVDISGNAVIRAREIGLDARVIDDESQLPFSDASFDAITCIEVFEHLFQPGEVASELFRVLKPGGVLVASVPNTVYWRRRLDFALLGRWNPLGDSRSVEQPWRDPHIRFFTLPAFRRMFRTVGFTYVRVKGEGGSIAGEIPWVGYRFRRDEPTRMFKLLERLLPSLFGYRLVAVARKAKR